MQFKFCHQGRVNGETEHVSKKKAVDQRNQRLLTDFS